MRMSHRLARLALATLIAPLSAACHGASGSSPVAPSPPPPGPVAPAVTGLAITGAGPLTRIGETVQLTATAAFSDGTTKDVSTQGAWHFGDPRILTVSASGLVTVVGFGATWVSVTYQARGAGATLTATPPGTFAFRGRVREPAAGGVLGARVVETTSGRSATTDVDGEFSIAELQQSRAHFKVVTDGYEPAELDATTTYIDLAIQRIVRLAAGETVSPGALAPHDLSYVVGGQTCDSCRLIRVVVSQAGTLHLHVTWTAVASNLRLFAEGQIIAGSTRELTADVPVTAPREVIIYLGAATSNSVGEHTPFTVATSMK